MSKRTKILRNVRDVVDALGGTYAAADWAGITPAAVSHWIAREFIPPGWHYRLSEEMRKFNCIIDPAVFGLNPNGNPTNATSSRGRTERRVA